MPKVSVLLPVLIEHEWQRHMTDCAIATMRCTTEIPFELVIVETLTESFGADADRYLHVPEKRDQVTDMNAGVDLCTGDFICFTGNDIFMKPGWLEALFECFEVSDCGIACIGMSELKHTPKDLLTEGYSGPLCMFKKGWRYDEAYRELFADTDLCMRVYAAGLRSYRNHKVVATHLVHQSTGGTPEMEAKRKERFDMGKKMFIDASRELGKLGFGDQSPVLIRSQDALRVIIVFSRYLIDCSLYTTSFSSNFKKRCVHLYPLGYESL